MSSSEPEKLFLHLLGKTGTGKSATGNSILGRKAFQAKSSLSPVTEGIHTEHGCMGTRAVEVVDGPALIDLDTGLSQDALHQFMQVIEANQDSAHVFLIVCRYGQRFTEDDQELIYTLKKTFGPKVFKDHSVVVLTCGDNYVRDTEDEALTFQQWCKEQTGAFSDLCSWCNDRVLLVNNIAKNNDFLNALEVEIAKLKYEDIKAKSLVTRSASGSALHQSTKNPAMTGTFSEERHAVCGTADNFLEGQNKNVLSTAGKSTVHDDWQVAELPSDGAAPREGATLRSRADKETHQHKSKRTCTFL